MLHFFEPSTTVIMEKWYSLVHSLYNSDSPLPSLAQPAAMPHVADTVCHLQTCFPETQHHSLKHRKSEAHRSNKRYGVYLENGVKWCCHNTSFLHYFMSQFVKANSSPYCQNTCKMFKKKATPESNHKPDISRMEQFFPHILEISLFEWSMPENSSDFRLAFKHRFVAGPSL